MLRLFFIGVLAVLPAFGAQTLRAQSALNLSDTWVLTVTGGMTTPQGVVNRKVEFEFCERSLVVRAIRHDDFSHFDKQGIATIVAPTVRDIPESLRIRSNGKSFFFREKWPTNSVEMVFNVGNTGTTIKAPKLQFPAGEHAFDLPIVEGVSTTWIQPTPGAKELQISYKYTLLKRKAVPGNRKIDVELLPIVPIKQEGNNCWAAVATMMVSWKKQQSLSVKQMLASADQKFTKIYNQNEGLADSDYAEFANALGMKTEPPKSYSIEELADLLKNHGPVDLNIEPYPNAPLSHEILIIGIQGDGTACGTEITYIGPEAGKVFETPYANILQTYESEDLTDVEVRAMHY